MHEKTAPSQQKTHRAARIKKASAKINLRAVTGWMSLLVGSYVAGIEMKPQLASIAQSLFDTLL
jgi:hypothetical protein